MALPFSILGPATKKPLNESGFLSFFLHISIIIITFAAKL